MTIAAAITTLTDLGVLPVIMISATVFVASYLYRTFKR